MAWLLFQASWLLAVVGSQSLWHWLVIPLIAAFLLFERCWSLPSYRQYLSRLLLALAGYTFDSLLMNLGIIQFYSSFESQLFAPSWLLLLWLIFGISFSVCYRWLVNHPILAMLFAAVFGPIAYWGSTHISQVVISDGVLFTILSSSFWALLFLLIFAIERIKTILIFDFQCCRHDSILE